MGLEDLKSVCAIRSEYNLPCKNCVYYEQCKKKGTLKDGN